MGGDWRVEVLIGMVKFSKGIETVLLGSTRDE